MNGGNKIGRVLVPNLICLRRDAKFRSGLIIYREKSKLHQSLDQVLRSHSCKILKSSPALNQKDTYAVHPVTQVHSQASRDPKVIMTGLERGWSWSLSSWVFKFVSGRLCSLFVVFVERSIEILLGPQNDGQTPSIGVSTITSCRTFHFQVPNANSEIKRMFKSGWHLQKW